MTRDELGPVSCGAFLVAPACVLGGRGRPVARPMGERRASLAYADLKALEGPCWMQALSLQARHENGRNLDCWSARQHDHWRHHWRMVTR